MGKPKTFRARVFQNTKEKTFGSWKTLILSLALFAVITFAKLYIFGRDSAMSYIQEFTVSTIVAGGLFWIFYSIFHFIFIAPYIVGKEQQGEIDQLTPVEGNIEITFDDEDKDFFEGDTITLSIRNKNTNADIEKCFVRPESIIRISVDQRETLDELKLKPTEYQKNLLWSNPASKTGKITIAAGTTETVNLLWVGERSMKFLFHGGSLEKEIPSTKDGNSHAAYGYAIFLKVHGKLNGQPITNDGEGFSVVGLLLPQLKNKQAKGVPEGFFEISAKKEPRLQVYIRR